MEEEKRKKGKGKIFLIIILSVLLIGSLALAYYEYTQYENEIQKQEKLTKENKELKEELTNPKEQTYLGYSEKQIKEFILNFVKYTDSYYSNPTDENILTSIAHGMALNNEDNDWFFSEEKITNYAKIYYNKTLTHPITTTIFNYDKEKKGYTMLGNSTVCKERVCEVAGSSKITDDLIKIEENDNKIEVTHYTTIIIKLLSGDEQNKTTIYKTTLEKENDQLIVKNSEIINK